MAQLVGREVEQAAISRLLDPAPDGPRALLLEGEAGIGKTVLWKAALSAAMLRDYLVLSSAPTEAESGLPYAVLCDLLDPIPTEAMASLSGPLRAALDVALFRAPAEQSPTDQLAISTALLRVLRHLATDWRVLVAIDDIQWMDTPSMRVLAFAVHRLDREQVKILAAVRVPAGSETAATLQRALPEDQRQQVAIGPLPLTIIDDLLLQRLPRPLRRPELDQVFAVSGGNPFFALEIGRVIVEHPQNLKTGEPLPVPASLAEAIKRRLTGLSPATRDVLVAMAALSRPEERLLHRVNSHATAALDEAANAQVAERSPGRLRFTHPLLASVIYSMTEPAGRRKLHLKLARLVTDLEERARHLALAATGPDASVANALEDAARSADARGAPDAAATFAQQASELTPPDLQEAIERRRIVTADYLMRAGDVPAARGLLEALLESSPAGKRPAEALRLMGTLTLGGEDLVEAERLLREALSQAETDLRTQAAIERDLVRVLVQQGRFHEALDHSVRFNELAASSDDRGLLAVAQRLNANTERLQSGNLSSEARATAIGLAEGRISVPPEGSFGGLHPLMEWAVLLKFSDEFGHARSLLKRVLALTEGRDESVRAPVLFHLAELECWTGDWLLAAVYLHECEKSVIHTGHRSYARLPLNAKALLHCYRGEFQAARDAAREALAISATVGDEAYLRRALATLGSTELAAGDPAAANQYFDTLLARGDRPGYSGIVRGEGDEAEALLAVGRIDEAERVAIRVAGRDDPWPRAARARIRGLVAAACGDLETSMGQFDEALSAHGSLAMPLERARTLLAYGTAQRRAKQKRAARQMLEEALATFSSLGAAAWIKRTEAELSRIAPSPAGVDSLTPTEARVAQLVAGGRTNKEVAANLFLSEKTVEANLSRIYAKLAVRSRTELAAQLTAQRRDDALRSEPASPSSAPR